MSAARLTRSATTAGSVLAQLQRKGHVLLHRLVRIERVVLEHHGDVALGRRQIVDDALADGDRAAGDGLQPGHHPEQRGLAAARRADQHDELAVGDIDADVVQDLDGSERLGHIADRDLSHHLPLSVAREANQCQRQGQVSLLSIKSHSSLTRHSIVRIVKASGSGPYSARVGTACPEHRKLEATQGRRSCVRRNVTGELPIVRRIP